MALRAPWIAAYVDTGRFMNDAARQKLARNLNLAEQLGAETVTLGGEDMAEEIVKYAQSKSVTKIIIGMSGGMAYVLDETDDFPAHCNQEMVKLEELEDPDEIEEIWKLIQRHQAYTKSKRAAKVLSSWRKLVPRFVKVMPKDYQRALQAMKKVKEQGLSGDQAVMAAFEENMRDVSRIGGG